MGWRGFDPAEDRFIHRLRVEGRGVREIGRACGRPANSIHVRLHRLAAMEEAACA